jgi:hypothetical protein
MKDILREVSVNEVATIATALIDTGYGKDSGWTVKKPMLRLIMTGYVSDELLDYENIGVGQASIFFIAQSSDTAYKTVCENWLFVSILDTRAIANGNLSY